MNKEEQYKSIVNFIDSYINNPPYYVNRDTVLAHVLNMLKTNFKYIDINSKTQIITPTAKGEKIYDIVLKSIPDMLNPELTASWEKGLDMVAKKVIEPNIFMEKLENYIHSKFNKLVVKY